MNIAYVLGATTPRRATAFRSSSLFTLGSALGGLLMGAVVAVLAGLCAVVPLPARVAVALVAGIALIVIEVTGSVSVLPQRARQIPQEVFGADVGRGAFRFGFEYGTGTRTHLTSGTPYVLIVLILVVTASPALSLLAGLSFGLGRTVPVLLHMIVRSPRWTDVTDRQAGGVAVTSLLLSTGVAAHAVLIGV